MRRTCILYTLSFPCYLFSSLSGPATFWATRGTQTAMAVHHPGICLPSISLVPLQRYFRSHRSVNAFQTKRVGTLTEWNCQEQKGQRSIWLGRTVKICAMFLPSKFKRAQSCRRYVTFVSANLCNNASPPFLPVHLIVLWISGEWHLCSHRIKCSISHGEACLEHHLFHGLCCN